MKNWMGLLCLVALVGCKTTSVEPALVSREEKHTFLKRLRDPRVFGLSIYEAPGGSKIGGGGWLHPSRHAVLPLLQSMPLRPVVMMTGRSRSEWPVLLDPTAALSRFEFETAQQVGAVPVGDGQLQWKRFPDDAVSSCQAIVPSICLNQLFIEDKVVWVRMKNGLPEAACRGIDALDASKKHPFLSAVIGWDVLKKFAQIQFLYREKSIVLKTTEPYEVFLEDEVLRLPLIDPAKECSIWAHVDGRAVPVLLDPAGDFFVATPNGETVSTLQIAGGMSLSAPEVVRSPQGYRLGARFLQSFRLTICPQAGAVYFEP